MRILPFAVAAWLFLVGIYGIASSRNVIQAIICLSVVQSSTYVVLLGVGYVAHGHPPIFSGPAQKLRAVDPVVQALTLTDIVVGVTVTALLLSLALQAHKRYKT